MGYQKSKTHAKQKYVYMMERSPRVWRNEKLEGSGKPERKMPLSTIEKLRGGMKRSSPSILSQTSSSSTVVVSLRLLWSVILSLIFLHICVSWFFFLSWWCWTSDATCCCILRERERERRGVWSVLCENEWIFNNIIIERWRFWDQRVYSLLRESLNGVLVCESEIWKKRTKKKVIALKRGKSGS